MRIRARFWGLGAVLTFGATVLVLLTTFAAAASGQAQHASWDIISVNFPITTVSPGGFAEARAPQSVGRIRLTGAGTFVAPAGSNGGSNAVTGGGTWETFSAGGASTGSGTYTVEELLTFEFAGFATPGFIDNIGDTNERANGSAVFRIAYSDGSQGMLWVGCHGPGAPDGIFEGIAASKGFTTYDAVQPPLPNVDANRTIFHVRR